MTNAQVQDIAFSSKQTLPRIDILFSEKKTDIFFPFHKQWRNVFSSLLPQTAHADTIFFFHESPSITNCLPLTLFLAELWSNTSFCFFYLHLIAWWGHNALLVACSRLKQVVQLRFADRSVRLAVAAQLGARVARRWHVAVVLEDLFAEARCRSFITGPRARAVVLHGTNKGKVVHPVLQ